MTEPSATGSTDGEGKREGCADGRLEESSELLGDGRRLVLAPEGDEVGSSREAPEGEVRDDAPPPPGCAKCDAIGGGMCVGAGADGGDNCAGSKYAPHASMAAPGCLLKSPCGNCAYGNNTACDDVVGCGNGNTPGLDGVSLVASDAHSLLLPLVRRARSCARMCSSLIPGTTPMPPGCKPLAVALADIGVAKPGCGWGKPKMAPALPAAPSSEYGGTPGLSSAAKRSAASCCASRASPCMKRQRGP